MSEITDVIQVIEEHPLYEKPHINAMSLFKVLRKSIAAEIKYTRHQELRWLRNARKAKKRIKEGKATLDNLKQRQCYDTFGYLENVRKRNLRSQSRECHIALAFMTGKSYYSVEQKVYNCNIPQNWDTFWDGVIEMITLNPTGTYDTPTIRDDVLAWRDAHPGRLHVDKMKVMLSQSPNTPTNLDMYEFGDVWWHH